MKNLIIIFLLFTWALVGCTEKNNNSCGYHNGNELIKGPDGGCYYINSNGNKTYVDRSECNC